MPYIILLVFTMLSTAVAVITRKKIFYFMVFIILVLFAGLRHNVGIDYKGYVEIFKYIQTGENISLALPSEKGYVYLMKIVNFFNGEQQFIFFIFAIVTQYGIYKFILRNSKNIPISLIIYLSFGPFFLGSLNLIRQYAAIAIFAYSIKYIQEKKFSFFLLLVCIGTFFCHNTLVLMLPFYFIANRKINFKIIFFIIILLICISKVIFFIISFTPYVFYLKVLFENNVNSMTYIYCMISFFLMIILYKSKYKDNVIYNMILLSCFIFLLPIIEPAFPSEAIFRINYYFFIAVIILIPDIIENIKNKHIRIILKIIIYILFTLYFIRTIFIMGNNYMLIPYNMNIQLF